MVPRKDMRKTGRPEVTDLNTSNTKEGMTQSPISRVPPPDDGQKKISRVPPTDDEKNKKLYTDFFYTTLGIATGYAGTIVIAKAMRAVKKKAK